VARGAATLGTAGARTVAGSRALSGTGAGVFVSFFLPSGLNPLLSYPFTLYPVFSSLNSRLGARKNFFRVGAGSPKSKSNVNSNHIGKPALKFGTIHGKTSKIFFLIAGKTI
jgi:hypothetical protein